MAKSNQFNLDEVFRQLRTSIEFAQTDNKIKVVNVVSTFPSEGKSTVSYNLAKISTDKYNRVLLIDCDLRNPHIHKMLRVSNADGLSNLVNNYSTNIPLTQYEQIKTITQENGKVLYYITAGNRVPNPAELLGSHKFINFLNDARKIFDFIVIDCPPYGSVSDCIPLSNAADGTLFVVSSRDTDKYAARTAMKDLVRDGGNLIGIILTKVESFQSRHYYYYGYGYGDESKTKKKRRHK